jgi:hypothetical protein
MKPKLLRKPVVLAADAMSLFAHKLSVGMDAPATLHPAPRSVFPPAPGPAKEIPYLAGESMLRAGQLIAAPAI